MERHGAVSIFTGDGKKIRVRCSMHCFVKRLGRPTRADAERLSDQVIEAAARLFAARGYAGTSIAAVAHEARVGKHTIYRRFPDKADLFRAVIDRYAERVLGVGATNEDAGTTALERLRDLLARAARLGNSATTEWVYRIAMAEADRFPELAAALMTNKDLGLTARLEALVTEAQAAGVFAPGDSRVVAELALEMVAGPFLTRRLSGTGFDDEAGMLAHFEKCWALFLRGVAA